MAFGYRRERGTGRGYVNDAGERLSRRQYDKLVAAAGAHRSASPAQRSRARAGQNVYNLNLDNFVNARRAAGEKITKKQAASDDRFKKVQADWKGKPVRRNRNGKPNRNDVKRNQRMRERAWAEMGMTADQWREAYEREEGRLVRATGNRLVRQRREGRGA